MLEPLRDIIRKKNSEFEAVVACVDRYKEKGGFMPVDLLFLLHTMESLSIDFDPGRFKVYLRSKEALEGLQRMFDSDFMKILPALSHSQRKRIVPQDYRENPLSVNELAKWDRYHREGIHLGI
ncbi:MAG: hypothetical protein ACSLFH_11225 [Desulfuromonadales bacterium]